MTIRTRATLALAACVALAALLSATTGEWRDGTVDPAVFHVEQP